MATAAENAELRVNGQLCELPIRVGVEGKSPTLTASEASCATAAIVAAAILGSPRNSKQLPCNSQRTHLQPQEPK